MFIQSKIYFSFNDVTYSVEGLKNPIYSLRYAKIYYCEKGPACVHNKDWCKKKQVNFIFIILP